MKLISAKHLSKRKAPVNLNQKDLALFKHEFEKEIGDTTLINLKNVVVFYDLIVGSFQVKKYLSYCHIGKRSNKKLILRILFSLRGYRKVDSGVWIIDNWSKGYFHWFTDALPRLVASINENQTESVILPETYKKLGYVIDSLKILDKEVTFYNPAKLLFIKKLLLPSHTASTGNFNSHLINELRRRFLEQFKEQGSKRVYISRQKAEKRKLLNESAITKLLTKYHFEIHCFEDYPLEKQIELMSQTSFLIGQHGAGLTNMLFMRSHGKILEFRNKTDSHNNCYFSMASELDHEYYYLLAEKEVADKNSDIEICTDQLKEILGKVLKEPTKH